MLKEGYTLPFKSRPNLTRLPTIINCYVHSHRNLYWLEALHQLIDKMQSSQFKISGLLQLTFLGSKTTQPLEIYSRSEQTKPFRDHQDLPPTRGVGYLNRFQGRLLPYTYTGTIQEITEISYPRSDIPVQGPAIRFVHSTHGVQCDTK